MLVGLPNWRYRLEISLRSVVSQLCAREHYLSKAESGGRQRCDTGLRLYIRCASQLKVNSFEKCMNQIRMAARIPPSFAEETKKMLRLR